MTHPVCILASIRYATKTHRGHNCHELHMPLNQDMCSGDTAIFFTATLDAFQAAGWVVILCFGALFALLAILLVWIDVKFSGVIYNSEQVWPSSASRFSLSFACDLTHYLVAAAAPSAHTCNENLPSCGKQEGYQRAQSQSLFCLCFAGRNVMVLWSLLWPMQSRLRPHHRAATRT